MDKSSDKSPDKSSNKSGVNANLRKLGLISLFIGILIIGAGILVYMLSNTELSLGIALVIIGMLLLIAAILCVSFSYNS